MNGTGEFVSAIFSPATSSLAVALLVLTGAAFGGAQSDDLRPAPSPSGLPAETVSELIENAVGGDWRAARNLGMFSERRSDSIYWYACGFLLGDEVSREQIMAIAERARAEVADTLLEFVTRQSEQFKLGGSEVTGRCPRRLPH